MTIVRLTASNVKRLSAVTITPDGTMVVLSGKNGQGKTSVLDAITYALAGTRAVCSEPIRRGEEAAEIVCDLGDIVVRRRFVVGGGTSLEVMTRDGLRYPSPQTVLDKLVGELTFDPLAFSRLKPDEQRGILQSLVGLDFTVDDKHRDLLYGERTLVNREAKAAEARLRSMPPPHADTPTALVSAGDVAAELQKAHVYNGENERARFAVTRREQVIAGMRATVERLRKELAVAEADLAGHEQEAVEMAERVLKMNDIDTAPLLAKMQDVDRINVRVRANQQRAEAEVECAAKKARSEELTRKIDEIETRKANAIAAASMPVGGLGLDAGGVTLNGLPLDQGSAAEQLRVSVAIGLAMNPRLRVLLIRDGSLLDADSLRLVAEMAKKAGAQVWIERVETDEATTVVINDGHVAEAPQ